MAQLTRSITLYNGEDLTPSHDYTTDTDWTQTELSTAGNAGEAAAGQWLVRDESGLIPDGAGTAFLSGHNVVIATVGSNTIWRGRIAGAENFRGRQKVGRAKEVNVTIEDQNSHLRGIVVHNWVRGPETDAARAQALVAAYLSGNPRATTNLNGSNLIITSSNTIAMPAKTYSGTTPFEIMQELADFSDKEFFVSIDNELAYFGHDYTGYASLLRISDMLADANATTYAPIDPRATVVSRDELSALRSYYGSDTVQSSVRVSNTSDAYQGYWEEVYWDSESVTADEAASRAQALLNFRVLAAESFTCTIGPMDGNEVWKIKPGQRIQFKAHAARGGRNPDGTFAGDSFGNARVREINWLFPSEDTYFARLQLERPNRTKVPRKGDHALATQPQPPTSSAPALASHGVVDVVGGGSPVVVHVPTGIAAGDWLITFVSCLYDRVPVAPAGWSTIYNGGATDGSEYRTAAFYKVADGTESGTVNFVFSGSVGGVYRIGTMMAFRGVNGYENVAVRGITGSLGAITDVGVTADGTGRLAVNLLYHAAGDTPTVYTGASGGTWVLQYADSNTNMSVGIYTADLNSGGSIDGGSYTRPSSTEEGQIIGFALVGESGTPIASSDASGTVGTDTGTYALADHVHPWQTVIPAIDAAGDVIFGTADNTPTRLAIGSSNTHLVSDGAVPRWTANTDFIPKSLIDAKGDLLVGTTNDNIGRLAVGSSNTHLVSDGTTALWFPQSAGGGGGSVATDTIWDAKGDLAAGTGADTASKLTVGADDTILMADSGQATGLKWVASASPSAVGTAAATGTADTFTRGDHVHAHETAHVTHDTIWDAKGDIVAATGADAASILGVGTDGQALVADSSTSTGLKWAAIGGGGGAGTGLPAGTSFPGSPTSGDSYFRTDLGEAYEYDGTRWLSFTVYTRDHNAENVGNSGLLQRIVVAGQDVYAVAMELSCYVNGTSNSTNYHKWNLQKTTTANVSSLVTNSAIDTNGFTTVTWTGRTQAIGTVVVASTHPILWMNMANAQGNPGPAFYGLRFTYRKIAT